MNNKSLNNIRSKKLKIYMLKSNFLKDNTFNYYFMNQIIIQFPYQYSIFILNIFHI